MKILRVLRALKAAAKAGAVARLSLAASKVKPLRAVLARLKRARKIHAPTRPTGKIPPRGQPGSYGYDATGKRLAYANSRPRHHRETVEEVWRRQANDRGEVWVRDRNDDLARIEWQPGQRRDGVWDMGHIPDKRVPQAA